MNSGDILLNRLERALGRAGGTHLLRDVMEMVEQGHAQMFGDAGGMVVTEIKRYPRLTALNMWLAAGELPAVLAQYPVVEAFARDIGATRLEGTGRMGWTRVMGRRGWQPRGILMVKDLA